MPAFSQCERTRTRRINTVLLLSILDNGLTAGVKTASLALIPITRRNEAASESVSYITRHVPVVSMHSNLDTDDSLAGRNSESLGLFSNGKYCLAPAVSETTSRGTCLTVCVWMIPTGRGLQHTELPKSALSRQGPTRGPMTTPTIALTTTGTDFLPLHATMVTQIVIRITLAPTGATRVHPPHLALQIVTRKVLALQVSTLPVTRWP